jgi:ATP-binding cassette subfamily C protein LapB
MLEKVYALEIDNHDIERPLIPGAVIGRYDLERVHFSYPGTTKGLSIQSLRLNPGEKVGVIGPIGAGKSTLLRLLSGMYRANEGRVLIDSLDIDQVSRAFLAEKIGYLQQEHRLFSGTLRENLLIGIPDPGDDLIKQAAEMSGLLSAIANHPKGLELPIAEGGKGLSGGQRQLVAFTRLLISKPAIWLLDEPTASMDSATEGRCLQVLNQKIQSKDTLILVTHKTNLLSLVNRLIVIANHQIVMDGPRDEIIKRLSTSVTNTGESVSDGVGI